MAEHGVADGRLAELAGHRDVLRMIEMLAAEEHDLPFQESVADLLHLLRRQGLAEVDAPDLRTDMQRQRDDFDIRIRAGLCCGDDAICFLRQ